MRILFQSRKTLFSVPGGDTIQILKTAEALREKGHHVDISTELEPDVTTYDIVHLFNLMRPQEVYLQALNAKKYGKKVALSTIYGPYIEYEKRARQGLAGLITKMLPHNGVEYLKIAARALRNFEFHKGTLWVLSKGYYSLQKRIVDVTNIFFPNSESEMRRVIVDLNLKEPKYVVVPNGVDAKLFDYDKVVISKEVEQYKDCILCVARIEERKGQLNLVRAMKGLPWQLVLIGKPAPNHLAYFNKIKKEAGPNVHIIGQVDHERLPQFYKAARVHALISWMESPGLSSLEAAVMGCNIVITEKGYTRDYFGDYAFYCEPDSIESIRDAIIKAYETPVNPELRQYILENYTWERAAEKTLEGYMKVL